MEAYCSICFDIFMCKSSSLFLYAFPFSSNSLQAFFKSCNLKSASTCDITNKLVTPCPNINSTESSQNKREVIRRNLRCPQLVDSFFQSFIIVFCFIQYIFMLINKLHKQKNKRKKAHIESQKAHIGYKRELL